MDNINNKTEEIEIDLARLFSALMKKAWLLGIAAVVCAFVTLVCTMLFVAPKYESSAMFYVNNNSISVGDVSLGISSSDISASKSLVKTYIVILNTRETLDDVIDYAGVDRTYKEVKNMIRAAAVDSTEVFRVTVTSEDPGEAERIASAIGYILPKRISSIIEGTSSKVVDSAVLPSGPSSPSYTKSAVIGFAAGLLAMAAVVVVLELLDNTIHTEEDITPNCKHPVLAAVPDMSTPSKGGYGKPDALGGALVGDGISFTASEAYKLLRTKLQFSFVDDGCHIIGISSALTGEGKSLSSVNLSYSISQLGKRVLLIDCDMRRPSLADKLGVRRDPGLSDYLTGQAQSDNLIQMCHLSDGTPAFHMISSGRIPPNPVELLSSAKMEKMLALLRERYDYIIMDLPPVREVSDALAAAKLTDGMLLVVRSNYCDRGALSAAVRQFEFVNSKILGVLFNCTSEKTEKYGKYYRRYGKKYYKYQSGYYRKQDAEPATKE